MSIIRIETVPQTWNDEYDTPFFTITARLFSAEFTYGAGVLLASFHTDVVLDESSDALPAAAPLTSSAASATDRALAPVTVRRTR